MPTINKGSDYFGVLTYTGDGAASKTVVDTNAVSFTPDFVWIKGRSGATDHALYDAVRGTTKDLVSNSTAAETTQSTGLTAFTNGGFTIGNLAKLNTSGATYTAWCWKAGGSTSSNTQGSITSTVSVNTTAGFSVLTYTGNNTLSTIGHGLGASPKFIIVKTRSGTDGWVVYHASLGVQYYSFLNTTDASYNNLANYWGSTAPSSTTFSINAYGGVNTNGATYVAYCWADVSGYSKAFSYTGNGSSDGPFTYLGFRPKFILLKNSNYASTNWRIFDTSRNTYNITDAKLYANSSSAESTASAIDILSNGFKIRDASLGDWFDYNKSGDTIIGIAFAEHPFKNSNSR